MSKKIDKKIDELKAHLLTKDWVEDRYGNLLKTAKNKKGEMAKYRMKFGPISLRYETQFEYIEQCYGSEKETVKRNWIRLASGYYKDITINQETGALTGMKR